MRFVGAALERSTRSATEIAKTSLRIIFGMLLTRTEGPSPEKNALLTTWVWVIAMVE
jgi:hypothetical protein